MIENLLAVFVTFCLVVIAVCVFVGFLIGVGAFVSLVTF